MSTRSPPSPEHDAAGDSVGRPSYRRGLNAGLSALSAPARPGVDTPGRNESSRLDGEVGGALFDAHRPDPGDGESIAALSNDLANGPFTVPYHDVVDAGTPILDLTAKRCRKRQIGDICSNIIARTTSPAAVCGCCEEGICETLPSLLRRKAAGPRRRRHSHVECRSTVGVEITHKQHSPLQPRLTRRVSLHSAAIMDDDKGI